MKECEIKNLYSLEETIAKELLEKCEYPWEALTKIGEFIIELGKKLDKNTVQFIYSLNNETCFGLYFNLKKNKLKLQINFNNKIRKYSISCIELVEKYKKQYADSLDKYAKKHSIINNKKENKV